MLLILDTCEHLIEAVAALASQIFIAAPQVHILATSREALRVEGEHVYRLDPLACPPDDPGLTAAVVQTFPATQLFLERAAASGLRLALGAERMDHPVSLTIVLHWAASVFLWTGDLASAEQHIDWFISPAETNSLGPSLAIGHGFKGELAIRLGDAKGGIEIVRKCLEKLQAASYELLTTPFNISLAQGLAAIGQSAEGVALIDETIRRVEANGDDLYLPELLRVKGGLLLSTSSASADEAERTFVRSIEMSRRQGARSWELRTAIDLAGLLADQGRRERSRTILRPVFEQFAEGLDTADLKAAESLLATLG